MQICIELLLDIALLFLRIINCYLKCKTYLNKVLIIYIYTRIEYNNKWNTSSYIGRAIVKHWKRNIIKEDEALASRFFGNETDRKKAQEEISESIIAYR